MLARTLLRRPPRRPQRRFYRHWWCVTPDEFALPRHSMPADMKELMANPDKREMDFFDHYWYWRVRKESTVLDPSTLPKTSYKQLAHDMGMPVVNPIMEHHMGILELYEYLKYAPLIGPFGTVENPTIVPSVASERQVACTGGTGDNEHKPLYFNAREGFLYRCGECDQIYMLARVTYGNSWAEPDYAHYQEMFEEDPDVKDTFDPQVLDRANKLWNEKDMLRWDVGAQVEGKLRRPYDMLDYPTQEKQFVE